MTINNASIIHCLAALCIVSTVSPCACGANPSIEVKQITFGPKNHLFGYIGHVQNIPWNQSGRYIVALQTSFPERMPNPGEAADVILIDTQKDFAIEIVDRTRAWNPQQGTMLYWNPDLPETQVFFNDSDEETKEVFTVLYDISKKKRVHEYRYADTPFGNAGVAQKGGYFLGINYARNAYLRPVTGYPGTFDWTRGEKHPANDGVFKVNIATGEKQLLVSYKQLAELMARENSLVESTALFINHTMWNRDDDLIKFSVRGNWNHPDNDKVINMGFLMNPDGSELTRRHDPIGGHNDWELGHRLLGAYKGGIALYDYDKKEIVEKVVDPGIFPDPKGDNAVSPDAKWLVNGSSMGSYNIYTIFRRSDKAWVRTEKFDRRRYRSGPTRIDGAPCWNRDSSQVLFPALTKDGTVQLFVITISE